MDSVIETLVAKAEALCYQLAPLDLVKSKLYIVRQSRIPPELGGNSICDGFTAPRLDLYLKDVIGPAWQGRGPCLVVNHTDYPETMDALDVKTDFFSTVLHELAHILERPPLAESGPKLDAEYLQFEALCMGRLLARKLTAEEEDDAFEGHGQNFLRIVLHLQQRAQEYGVWLTPFWFCGYRYGVARVGSSRETQKWTCINDGQTTAGFFVIQINGNRVRAAFRTRENVKYEKAAGSDTKRIAWDGSWGWKWPLDKKFSRETPETQPIDRHQ